MLTVTGIDLTHFNRTVARFHDELWLDLRDELRRTQIPLLVTELVKRTPPANIAQAARPIERDARRIFYAQSRATNFGARKRKGKKFANTTWLLSTSSLILGVLNDMFQPEISALGMRALAPSGKPPNSLRSESVGTRGSQSVHLLNRIVVSKKSFVAYVKNKLGRIGRLKAGWMVCADAVGGVKRIPAWVSKHMQSPSKAKLGYYVDGLGAPNYPTFTIVNTARGAGDLSRIAQSALDARVRMMIKDIAFRIRSGIKRQGL